MGSHNPGDTFSVGTTTVTYTATDASGNTAECTFDVTVDLIVLDFVLSDYNGFNVSCNGGADGEATVNVTGGTPDYSYAWSDGQTTMTATGLSAGSYTVTVTDATGCTETGSVSLTEPPALVPDAIVSSDYNGSDISCFGESDGEITASATGGVMPYAYAWE